MPAAKPAETGAGTGSGAGTEAGAGAGPGVLVADVLAATPGELPDPPDLPDKISLDDLYSSVDPAARREYEKKVAGG